MTQYTRAPFFPTNTDDFAPWVATHGLLAPYGECQCGCGQPAPLATEMAPRQGRVRGMPTRFISGHNGRVQNLSPKKPLEQRLWKYVERRGEDECWLWTGHTIKGGYGTLYIDKRNVGAHRVSWELHNGPIPDGMKVCHECDNPPCCNPKHLFLGTLADNAADMVKKGRQVRGENQAHAKLNASKVREIRKLYAAGVSSWKLSKQFGVTDATILCAVKRKTWKHVQ